jgi:DNA modification methylase
VKPTVQLFCGDCLEILPTLDKTSIDAVVTDPHYFDIAKRRIEAEQAKTALFDSCKIQ